MKILFQVFISALLLLLYQPTLAAVSGDLSSTRSIGSTNISLTIPVILRAAFQSIDSTNRAGIIFNSPSTITASLSHTLCILTNDGSSTYSARFLGSGKAGAFTVKGRTSAMPYTVSYDDGSGANIITAGKSSLYQQYKNTKNLNCNGGSVGKVIISLPNSSTLPNPSAVYLGTLTLLLAPE